jgi:hypothetical protein
MQLNNNILQAYSPNNPVTLWVMCIVRDVGSDGQQSVSPPIATFKTEQAARRAAEIVRSANGDPVEIFGVTAID